MYELILANICFLSINNKGGGALLFSVDNLKEMMIKFVRFLLSLQRFVYYALLCTVLFGVE